MDDQAIAVTWGFAIADLAVLVLARNTAVALPYAGRELPAAAGLIFASQLITIIIAEFFKMRGDMALVMDVMLTLAMSAMLYVRPSIWLGVVVVALAAQVGIDFAHMADNPDDDFAFMLFAGVYDVLFVVQLVAVVARCVTLIAEHRATKRAVSGRRLGVHQGVVLRP